jgi:hypothetical protein
MPKPIFVFLDDAFFELENFRNNIAPAAPEIEFVYDSTFEGAEQQLGDRPVHLFLLDLFGSDPAVTTPQIPSLGDLERMVSDLPTLDQVYEGLDLSDSGNINEYLRRLFAVVDGWRNVFTAACDGVGQNRNYGLTNLGLAMTKFPYAARAAYTRKALFADAAACFSAGFDGLFNKPPGRDDAGIAATSRGRAPDLVRAWGDLVDRRLVISAQARADGLEEAACGPTAESTAWRTLGRLLAAGDREADRRLDPPPGDGLGEMIRIWLAR